MFIDARELADGTLIEVDLAIVGGGPAGITLARALGDLGIDICLIESGGHDMDPQVQSLYDGDNLGIEYPLLGMRLRFLGGSSNHWGGYCRPLDPIDFEVRDWVPFSGWPFGIDALSGYYEAAAGLVQIAPTHFGDPDYWEAAGGGAQPEPPSGRMQRRYFQFSPPTHFGRHYRADLDRAKNIRVLLHANVVNIASTGQGKSVTRLDLQTLTGLRHRVVARRYVLAAGGLENPRLLLLSDQDLPGGLGNSHDLVGRFFMEHPHLSSFGEIVVTDLARVPGSYRRRITSADGLVGSAAFSPSAAFMRERRLLNAVFMAGEAGFYGVEAEQPSEMQRQHRSMLQAARPFIGGGGCGDQADSGGPAGLGHWLGLGCACEQVPNPDSRVMLSDVRDALGLRRIRLDWRLSEQDRRSVVELIRVFGVEFGALGMGRMRVAIADDGVWPEQVVGGGHHMGTTRMHQESCRGVVDPDCRVHGVDNLYIAGSSVFPTGGAVNPTLTLLALTLRLADHLRAHLR